MEVQEIFPAQSFQLFKSSKSKTKSIDDPPASLYISLDRIQDFEVHKCYIQEFVCFRCDRLPSLPLQCSQCDIVLCQECLNNSQAAAKQQKERAERRSAISLEILANRKERKVSCCCPGQCVGASFRRIRTANKVLRHVKVKCKNWASGCEGVWNYFDVEEHEKQCEFQMVKCREFELCGCEMLAKDMIDHEMSCDYIYISCYYCQEQIRRQDSESHLKTCPNKLFKCQYCFQEFFNQELLLHEISCDEQDIQCEQCKEQFKQKQKSDHSCIAYLSSKIQQNEQVIQQSSQIIEQMRQEIFQLQHQEVFSTTRFWGEEWLFLCKVARKSKTGYYDDFWIREEPLNSELLSELARIRKDFQKSVKSPLFFKRPVSEILICTEMGTKARLKLPKCETLCKLFQEDKPHTLQLVGGVIAPYSLIISNKEVKYQEPIWGINLKSNSKLSLCRLGGFFQFKDGKFKNSDSNSPNVAGFGLDFESQIGFGFRAANEQWFQEESKGAVIFGK